MLVFSSGVLAQDAKDKAEFRRSIVDPSCRCVVQNTALYFGFGCSPIIENLIVRGTGNFGSSGPSEEVQPYEM